MGKAGGGTVRAVFEALKIKFIQIHVAKNKYPRSLVDKGRMFLVTIRDPVDRFISAFNYIGRVYCHNNDTREVLTKENRIRYNLTEKGIQSMCKDDKNIIESRYNFNVNKFAEALCDEEEKKYVKMISHMKYSITDFLGTLLKEHDMSSFKFMIMEPEYDFLLQIKSALEVVVNMTQHEKQLEIPEPIQQYLYKNVPRNISEDYLHKSQSSTNTQINQPISNLGACCVARYYEKDYKLLEELYEGGTVCDGRARNECMEALHSILERRTEFYNTIENHSCSHIAEEMKPLSENIDSTDNSKEEKKILE